MDLNTLTPGTLERKKRKRVGRGPSSGHGKTSGKGHKGQKARSGYSRRFGFEGGQMPLIRRLPKRGFRHDNRHGFAAINLDILDKWFEDGEEVSAEVCFGRRLVKVAVGGIKILSRGEMTKKLRLKVAAISEAARQKAEAAGCTVEIVPAPAARAVVRRTKKRAPGKR